MFLNSINPIFGCFFGCINCMYFVELIAKTQSSSMNLMTFSTFLFISVEGLIFTSRFFTVPNKIPLRGYLPTILTFFIVNVINNQALNYRIPVPLHIIFRSGTLLASLIMTRILQNKTYSIRKYLSILMITLGIIICTLETAKNQKNVDSTSNTVVAKYRNELFIGTIAFSGALIGITMLVVALIASAYLAICQEQMYVKYGKHTKEAMFVVHASSLPFFALFGKDILRSTIDFSRSESLEILSMKIPYMWAILVAVCILQWICIHFVYRLNAERDSLTVTMVVTVRKFISLLISIVWFKNQFTIVHWIGTFLVFTGSLAFADIWNTKHRKLA